MESKIEAATGKLVVKKVGGKSTVTRCFSKYPLKFIIPNKVGSSETDAVWVYTLTYGGGIVSGDSISCEITVADACTAVLTTQASTKVYKSLGSKSSEQILEAKIGSDALLAVIPDPVTCFSTARYSQKQIFRVVLDSSLVIVDWITSGRHESGEKWDFELYRSTNHIFLEGVAGTREHYQHCRTYAGLPSYCDGHTLGGIGIVVRIAAMTTESVYRFLQHQLAGMETLLGVSPYS
ncbi:urease accessory protein D isoform X2 [Citrus clementina]|uniref:urease accessory protein D isoform X2 n=1 Tax=Citrus clementina TaxID=85681 RepID=UPI000CED52D0|nr:urease accessory protein D isoform X2 [Citrus x clementina]